MNKYLVGFALLLVAFAYSEACPTIITRAGWNARAGSSTILATIPAPYYVVHHTDSPHCTTQAVCSQQMRNIQNWHMDGNGWADIGYNFIIGEDGLVYEGRGWGRTGAHAPGFNSRSIGISFFGTFTNGIPNLAARNAAQTLIACGVRLGHVSATYGLIGHRQAASTACPGNALFANIQTWDRWTANPSSL